MHLACRGHRQFIDEFDFLWILVGRQLTAHVILQFRHQPRIGRIVMGRGRDAGDVPITMAFGQNQLLRFEVTTEEVL